MNGCNGQLCMYVLFLESYIFLRMITEFFTSFDNLNFDWAKAKQSLKANLKDFDKVNGKCAKGVIVGYDMVCTVNQFAFCLAQR